MRHTETIAQFDCTSGPTGAHSVPRTQTVGRTHSETSLLCLILISRSRRVSHFLEFSFFFFLSLLVFNSRAKSCVCNLLLFFFLFCFWCPLYSVGINHLLIACTCSKQIRSSGRALRGDCCALNILSKKKKNLLGLFFVSVDIGETTESPAAVGPVPCFLTSDVTIED